MYRLDKTQFEIKTFEEASNAKEYWLAKTPNERIYAAWYLICAAYRIDSNSQVPMKKNIFSMRKNG
jgi:uncharacterized protein (UPF0262 family)